MLIDARDLNPLGTIETDVCIVGAGAAGLSLGCELASRGTDVCVLESGGRVPEYDTQALARGEISGLPYYPLDANRQRALGGTLWLWAGWCRPLDELDLAGRDWVPHSGWPIGRDALMPGYERAHRRLGLGPPEYGVEYWERAIGAARVGLDPDEAVTRMYHLAQPKSLAATTAAELERSPNARLILHTNLLELETDEAGSAVTGARIGRLDGARGRVRARRYVLAMGAIENARMLLVSRGSAEAGLGNAHDQVGRYFMEHMHFPSGRIRLADRRSVSPALYFRTGRDVIARLFLPEEVQARERILNSNTMLEPLHADLVRRGFAAAHHLMLSVDRVVTKVRRLGHLARRYAGPAAARSYRRGLPGADHPARELLMHHTLEQAPNPESRVTLDRETDPLGLPRVKLEWRTSDVDRRTMVRGRDLIGQAFERAGLGMFVRSPDQDDTIWPPQPLQGLRGHHMGTTRMHADRRRGVVDADCRVHGVRNLYVAGSSVFPTSGSGTPTITIVALALRLADHLRSRGGLD